MNTKELKIEMLKNDDTDMKLADFLGISRSSVSLKKTGKIPFKRDEIKAISERYNLSPERIVEIFFT